MKFARCECITDDMVLALREDPTGLSPSIVACLNCLPTTCCNIPVNAMPIKPLLPAEGATLGQVITDDWCQASGLIRGRAPHGTEQLLICQPDAPHRWIVREPASGRYFVWDDPSNLAKVQNCLGDLPEGRDRVVVADSIYTFYVVREVNGKLCLLTPDSATPWPERRFHPDDQYVLLGNENIYADLERGRGLRTAETPFDHDDIFLLQSAGLAHGRGSLGVQCVLRLR